LPYGSKWCPRSVTDDPITHRDHHPSTPDIRGGVQQSTEHRSIPGYLQSLIQRDLQVRDEAERIIGDGA
jgi:hypothetical protein